MTPLHAHSLKEDSRVAAAKKMLMEAVKEHSEKITDIKPANPALKVSYDQLIEEFCARRAGKLWFPFLGSGIGNGALVELLDGSIKYDFISGIGSHFWGHTHPDLISVGIDAALSDTVMQGHLQQNGDSPALAKLLCEASGMDHCYLSTSGAMANENAFKISFQKNYPANRILAFEGCFAGRTLLLSQITDKASFREGLPNFGYVDYLPFFDAQSPEQSIQRTIDILKRLLKRHPKKYAAMIFEFVQGEGGFYPGSKPFFSAIMEILKEEGIAIIADEIQSFGRTTQLFAFQHFELQPYVDIVTIGKMVQACATLFKKEYAPRFGLLSQTFTSSTIAIRAAQLIVNDLLKGGYFGPSGKNAQLFKVFEEQLSALEKRYPDKIRGPFGIGTMIAFTVFNGDAAIATRFAHALFDAGVLCFIAGSNPTRIRFLLPAKVVTPEQIVAVCNIIEKTLTNFVP